MELVGYVHACFVRYGTEVLVAINWSETHCSKEALFSQLAGSRRHDPLPNMSSLFATPTYTFGILPWQHPQESLLAILLLMHWLLRGNSVPACFVWRGRPPLPLSSSAVTAADRGRLLHYHQRKLVQVLRTQDRRFKDRILRYSLWHHCDTAWFLISEYFSLRVQVLGPPPDVKSKIEDQKY